MTLYLLITENRSGGYRVRIQEGIYCTRPKFQSATENSVSDSKYFATRLFGKLDWKLPKEIDPNFDLNYVKQIAVISVDKGIW